MMSAMNGRQRLEAALRVAGADTFDASELYAELERRYGEAHRAYHTMTHVRACLGWLNRFVECADRPAEIELALWFHDVVYDPTRGDNEAQSAAFGADWMARAGVPPEVSQRVVELVLSTQRHRATDGDAALLSSIDLAILGAGEDAYARFEHAVRREYGHVPEASYPRGRTAVLRGFLDRAVIYEHAPARDALEMQARKNLAAAIAALEER